MNQKPKPEIFFIFVFFKKLLDDFFEVLGNIYLSSPVFALFFCFVENKGPLLRYELWCQELGGLKFYTTCKLN